MAETLLTPSSIKLFGRIMSGIIFSNNTTAFGGNYFLQRQLSAAYSYNNINGSILQTTTYQITIAGPPGTMQDLTVGMTLAEAGGAVHIQNGTVITSVDQVDNLIGIYPPATIAVPGPVDVVFSASISPQLARIYSFSFEGGFYALPRPPIFLVHGSGLPVGGWTIPSTVDQSGVAAREWDFSGNPTINRPSGPNDLVYWEYEKGDFSLRLDLDAGPFEQILLQMALRGAGGVSGAGVSGAGVSGAGVSGAGVSGAGVSGAGVSGAGVSGAGVSGAGVRR